ncbi:MAG: PocR ligand-binding domain-containing protein [bacterium]|nr:PocR ligand-binding domain-containing protein [bacterium]
MGKVKLSDIVNLPAFEEAGRLFHRATGMTISFYSEAGENIFYPAEERCEVCHMIQSKPEGQRRCLLSDKQAAEQALRCGKPVSYTCHAGLIDVVVPVVVAGRKIGCFFSGQSLLASPTPVGYQDFISRTGDLGLDPDKLWEAYLKVPVVDAGRLDIALGLLGVICNHLVEGQIALRKERELTRKQRKLRQAAEEKAGLERDLREVELRLVQAQLNPHFLFNALNLIAGQAMAEDAAETGRLIEELSLLLRHSLSNIGGTITLAEEAAAAMAYVEVFRARFGREVEVAINIPQDLGDLHVPALILQPLVETSLVHALPACPDGLRIAIGAAVSGSRVELRVADNGPGLPDEAVIKDAVTSDPGVGIKLTGLPGLNRRLQYYYPDLPGLELFSLEHGLTAVISLPLP